MFRWKSAISRQVSFLLGIGGFSLLFRKGPRGKHIGEYAKCISEANKDYGTDGKRDVVRMLISHVGDLLISGPDSFIAYLSGKLEHEYGVKVVEGGGATYLVVGIKKAANEFIGDGDIYDGA